MSMPAPDYTVSADNWVKIFAQLFGKPVVQGGKVHKFGTSLVDIRGGKVYKVGDDLLQWRDSRLVKIGGKNVVRDNNQNLVSIGGEKFSFLPRVAASIKKPGSGSSSGAKKPSTRASSSGGGSSGGGYSGGDDDDGDDGDDEPQEEEDPYPDAYEGRRYFHLSQELECSTWREFSTRAKLHAKPHHFPVIEPVTAKGWEAVDFNGFYVSPLGRVLRFFPQHKNFGVAWYTESHPKLLDVASRMDPTGATLMPAGSTASSSNAPNAKPLVPWTENDSARCFNPRLLESKSVYDEVMAEWLREDGEGLHLGHRDDDENFQKGTLDAFNFEPGLQAYGIYPVDGEFDTMHGRSTSYHVFDTRSPYKIMIWRNFSLVEPYDRYFYDLMLPKPADVPAFLPHLHSRALHVRSTTFQPLLKEDSDGLKFYLKCKRDEALGKPLPPNAPDMKWKYDWSLRGKYMTGSLRLRNSAYDSWFTLALAKPPPEREPEYFNRNYSLPNAIRYKKSMLDELNEIPEINGKETDAQIDALVDKMVRYHLVNDIYFFVPFPADVSATHLVSKSDANAKRPAGEFVELLDGTPVPGAPTETNEAEFDYAAAAAAAEPNYDDLVLDLDVDAMDFGAFDDIGLDLPDLDTDASAPAEVKKPEEPKPIEVKKVETPKPVAAEPPKPVATQEVKKTATAPVVEVKQVEKKVEAPKPVAQVQTPVEPAKPVAVAQKPVAVAQKPAVVAQKPVETPVVKQEAPKEEKDDLDLGDLDLDLGLDGVDIKFESSDDLDLGDLDLDLGLDGVDIKFSDDEEAPKPDSSEKKPSKKKDKEDKKKKKSGIMSSLKSAKDKVKKKIEKIEHM